MIDFIKKYHYELAISASYTLLACLAYGIWSYSAWSLWYVSLIIVIFILFLGVLFGTIWIKHSIDKE